MSTELVARRPGFRRGRVALAVAVALSGFLLLRGAAGQPLPGTEAPGADPHLPVASAPPARLVASQTAAVLGGATGLRPPALGMTVVGPDGSIVDASSLVAGPTFFFYYSASCAHCQHVAAEVAALARRLVGIARFVGIGSGSNSITELAEFKKTYALPFDSFKDYTRMFARDNGATSTPQLLFMQPKEGGGFESLAELRPFASGMSLPAELRALTVAGKDPWSAFRAGEWHGSEACGVCHETELRAWGLTHHSIAYWTLYERQKAEDPGCVGCHVTGLGAPGGFALADHGSALTDVTCEACHGAGGPHVPGARVPASAAREICVSCHDADHSVRFSVERALPHIDHFRPEANDPTAFARARALLVDGKAPRPLTAFPEGQNLGNGACVDCHARQVKALKKDPHAAALQTLIARGSQEDPACLSCHAVARVTPPAVAQDFHGDGVGCEACHGPGEQHVAAGGGKETIVGLGESCPVCIIEAICTNCHTPEQDADWNLDQSLKKLTPHR